MATTETENLALKKLSSLGKAGKKMSISDAQKWFKDAVQKSMFVSKRKGRIGCKLNKNSLVPGMMFTYIYEAKGDGTPGLPFWDMHPLVLVIGTEGKYMLGLSLHYLPTRERIALLTSLMKAVIGKSFKKRVQISYDMLKGASKYRAFKPTIKKYLVSNIKTIPILIPFDDWPYAAMLPSQKFKGASRSEVYKDSLKIMKG